MELTNLGIVLALNAVSVMTPGPDLFMVLRFAARSRRHAFASVAGICTTVLLWATLSVTGVAALVSKYPVILNFLQLFGGFWLSYMAFGLFRQVRQYYRDRVGANSDVDVAPALGSVPAAYRTGLVTNLSNPKALLYFTAILTPFLPMGAPWWVSVVYIAAIVLSAGVVFGLVAFFVSTDAVRSRLLSVTHLIDLVAAVIFSIFAAVLLYEGISNLFF